jgi:predicted enzyme related to lactoylglutathione lyase
MPEFTKHAPGTPAWVDLGTKDVGAAATFYADLFGWDAEDLGEQAGHYTMMKLRGRNVAAISPLMNPMQPVAWSTYLATADVDETARKVKDAGGTVVSGPFDVFDAGRMAVFVDPTGAAILAWQAGEHTGVELANEANTLLWNELYTPDVERAKSFYRAAFDLEAEAVPSMDYTLLKVGDRAIGGIMATGPGSHVPAEVPPHWNVYFAVDDVDATVAKIERLGGSTMVPPTDIPGIGRFAVVADPQGASFSVMRGEGEPSAPPS